MGTDLIQIYQCNYCDERVEGTPMPLLDQGYTVFPYVPKGWTRFGVHSLNELACPRHVVEFQVREAVVGISASSLPA